MFEKEIKLGMEYLDAHEQGWVEKIDLSKLNMMFGDQCVLGQLQGPVPGGRFVGVPGFTDYMYKHGLTTMWAVNHGFILRVLTDPFIPNDPVREALWQVEWFNAIQARKAEKVTAQKIEAGAALGDAEWADRELVLV